MSDEPKFPLHFKCPSCKADKGTLQLCAQTEMAEGFLPPDVPVATAHHNILLADEGKIQSGVLAGKKIRMLFYYADICSKCGNQYIYLVEMKDIIMPAGAPHGQSPRIVLPGMGPLPSDITKRSSRGDGGGN
jgi:hypothetical protein